MFTIQYCMVPPLDSNDSGSNLRLVSSQTQSWKISLEGKLMQYKEIITIQVIGLINCAWFKFLLKRKWRRHYCTTPCRQRATKLLPLFDALILDQEGVIMTPAVTWFLRPHSRDQPNECRSLHEKRQPLGALRFLWY